MSDLGELRAAYLEAVGGNPAMALPVSAMAVLLDVLEMVQPAVVLEQGCGWSTTLLAPWGVEHDTPVIVCESDSGWRTAVNGLLEAQNAAPVWEQSVRAWAAAVHGQTWVALVDGDSQGRRHAVRELYTRGARGVILFDDANADYVQLAMAPLKTARHGTLYDLQARTRVTRNQDTWCALWVGSQVRAQLKTLVEGVPVCA